MIGGCSFLAAHQSHADTRLHPCSQCELEHHIFHRSALCIILSKLNTCVSQAGGTLGEDGCCLCLVCVWGGKGCIVGLRAESQGVVVVLDEPVLLLCPSPNVASISLQV